MSSRTRSPESNTRQSHRQQPFPGQQRLSNFRWPVEDQLKVVGQRTKLSPPACHLPVTTDVCHLELQCTRVPHVHAWALTLFSPRPSCWPGVAGGYGMQLLHCDHTV